jgi:hypothetical protein
MHFRINLPRLRRSPFHRIFRSARGLGYRLIVPPALGILFHAALSTMAIFSVVDAGALRKILSELGSGAVTLIICRELMAQVEIESHWTPRRRAKVGLRAHNQGDKGKEF